MVCATFSRTWICFVLFYLFCFVLFSKNGTKFWIIPPLEIMAGIASSFAKMWYPSCLIPYIVGCRGCSNSLCNNFVEIRAEEEVH